MDEPRRSESVLPVSLMVALAAAIAGGVLLKEPLKSSRPPITEEWRSAPEKVNARLWQDPFRAVAQHRQKEESARREAERVRIDVTLTAPTQPAVQNVRATAAVESPTRHHHSLDEETSILEGMKIGSYAVLGVMLDGTPYSEGSESRLRSRYAVVSALDTAGYTAVDGEHIQFFTWQPPDGRCESTADGELTIPFELYEPNTLLPDNTARPHVLVLWLNDDEFAPAPLCLLAALKGRFQATLPEHDRLEFGFIGPRSSNSLVAMLKDARTLVAAHIRLSPNPDGRSVPLYSPWATAWYPILARELDVSAGQPGLPWIRGFFRGVGVDFVPTIQTDYALATELADELARRGVTPGKDAIALIYELDTFYGRALPLTLATVANRPTASAAPDGVEADAPLTDEVLDRRRWADDLNIHSYVYLRGLDGELPRPSDANKEAQAAPISAGKGPHPVEATVGVEALERPIGPGQLDYVRRLARQMVRDQQRDQQQDEQRDEHPAKFRAIGVVGSDVYDKLLVLQAVRPYFPGATYFTTDLDARLLHRDQLPWTRNLIVASGFGLSLHRDRQGDIPPFRDVYQTAVFYACLRALERLAPQHGGTGGGSEAAVASPDSPAQPPESVDPLSLVHPGGHARLYEIGLAGAVDLSVDGLAPDSRRIHPTRGDLLPSWRVCLTALLGIVFGAALVIPFIGVRAWAWVSAAGLLIAGAVMGLVLAGGAEGEPFAWLEGVSIWPAFLLRLIAGALSAYFIILSFRQLRDNFQGLSEKFRLVNGPPASEAGPAEGEGLVNVATLWKRYGEDGEERKRALRAGLFVVVVVGFAWMLAHVLGPPSKPFRGPVSQVANFLALLASVLSMLFLFGMILDATLLCKARLIEPLIGKTPGWPRDLIDLEVPVRGTDIPFWDQWLAVSLIGEHTEVVRRLIYFPFIALSIMIVSRNRLFDNFDFPPMLITIWVVISLLAIASVWTLRSRAEGLRKSVVDRLSDELVRTSASEPARVEQLKLRIERLRNFRLGVFASPLNQPVVSAVLLGALSVLQFFLVQE